MDITGDRKAALRRYSRPELMRCYWDWTPKPLWRIWLEIKHFWVSETWDYLFSNDKNGFQASILRLGIERQR